MQIIFITGGQRSGKSSYAQKLAESLSENPVYLATSRIWDDDFKKRIERHKQDRGDNWLTIEEDKELSKLIFKDNVVVLDCVTLWLTNLYYDNKYDIDKTLQDAKREFNALVNQDFILIVVSNEIGMGIHADNESARKFTDLQGWINQYIASLSDDAWLMVSGIPVKIK